MLDGQSYSILAIKSVDEQRRRFSGTATTPAPDAYGDVIEPTGVSFTNPLPLLLHHDVERPVGTVRLHQPTAKGVDFDAEIPVVKEAGVVKTRVDEAWDSIRTRLISAVSVRVAAKKDDVKRLPGGGIHWLKSQIKELSLVTIPANHEATIAVVKSLDSERPAASGIAASIRNIPGATGALDANPRRSASMKTTPEKIQAIKSTKDTKIARIKELDSAVPDGEIMSEAARQETEDLEEQVKGFDAELSRLERLDRLNVTTATPVNGTNTAEAVKSRDTSRIITVERKLPKGIGFARVAMCVAAAKGSRSDAIAIAEQAYPGDNDLLEAVKTAVGAATTANNQAPAVQYVDALSEFIEYLRSKTILDKFGTGIYPALHKIGFNTRVTTQTAGATASWVGEGKPKPLSKGTFGTLTIDFSKIAVICVLTKEEVRFGRPSSEAKVRDDMARAIAAGIDTAFLDPANAGTAGVKPASITYNVAATAVSNTTPAALRLDLKNMVGTMIAAGIQPNSLVLIMSQGIALSLSLSVNTLGNRDFPDLTKDGGYLFGIPVIVSEALTGVGSPTANMIVAVNADDVYLADDGMVSIDASEQASLQMDDAPGTQDGTTGTGTSLVSLWQTNMLGLRAEREISWKLTRAAAVQYLSGVAYVPS